MKFKPLLFIIVLIFTIITAQSISCENLSKQGVYHVGPYKISIDAITEIKRSNKGYMYIFYAVGFVEKHSRRVGSIISCNNVQNSKSYLVISGITGRARPIIITPFQLH